MENSKENIHFHVRAKRVKKLQSTLLICRRNGHLITLVAYEFANDVYSFLTERND